MKKFLFVLMAVCLTFAMISCDKDSPGGHTYDVTISFDLNWPDDAEGTAPAGPGSIGLDFEEDEDFALLTSTQISSVAPSSSQRPSGYVFVGWFLTKAAADAATTGKVTTSTQFEESTTLYAGWEEAATLDLTGVVEEITLSNAQYAVFQFTLASGKTWSAYKNISVEYAADADNIGKSFRALRVLGNYTPNLDFEFLLGTGDAEGLNKAVAPFIDGDPNNKNGPFIMDNGGNASMTIAALIESKAAVETAMPNTWYTINYPDISAMEAHGQFVAANKPGATATGPFYLAIGLPSSSDDKEGITFFIKNVKLVGTSSADTVTAIPAIFTLSTDTPTPPAEPVKYAAFAGYASEDGDHGYAEATRQYVGTALPAALPAPIVVTMTDDAVDIIFDYNYPTGAGITAGTEPAVGERTKRTDGNGKLSTAQLAALTGAALPSTAVGPYRFAGWYTTATDTPTAGVLVTNATVFATDDTIYARYKNPLPVPTTALVIDAASTPALAFTVHGSNNKATLSGTVAEFDTNGDWALMTSRTLSAIINDVAGSATNDTLASAVFPPAVGDYLYTKVIVTYDAVLPTKIIAADGTTEITAEASFYPHGTAGATMGGNLKKGAPDSWTNLDGSAMYPDFVEGTDQTFTWDLTPFGGDASTGFSVQYNASQQQYPKRDGWLLKITKLEFTTEALIATP